MTELEYVLEGFEQKLILLKEKRILIHGSRSYAEAIIDRFSSSFLFIGVMSNEPIHEPLFHGIPVFQQQELDILDIEAVLITERVKYAEEVFQSIHSQCERRNILIYNMYGVNEVDVHRELKACRPQSITGWKTICSKYDIVAFEVMDTVLVDLNSEVIETRGTMVSLIRWLLERGIDVKFSLRKSYDEGAQITALEKAALCSDIKDRLISRKGEDLSFRRLKEENPGKKILYIGMGLINECILPRYYGIDTYRFVYTQNNYWYMPVGDSESRVSFNAEWKEQVRWSIRESDIISFDIFDTLIIRKVLQPWDVFQLVEKCLKDREIPIDGFAQERKTVGENYLYATISEIYSILRERRNWSTSFAQEVMSLELEIERKVVLPRTEVIELFLFAVQEGKTVVLTSDMYYPAEIMKGLLGNCGISGFDQLLISCDLRKDKRTGLFNELIKLFGKDNKILHIGDDPVADGEMCKNAGISSVLLPSPVSIACACNWENCILSVNTLMERCLLGMCISELFRDPFQNPNIQDRPLRDRLRCFCFSVIVPLSIGFMTWLIRELHRDPCDGVLFVARDGFFLRQIYRSLDLKTPLPPSYYYYTSRHAAFLCCSDREDFIPFVISQCLKPGTNEEEILCNVYDLDKSEIKPKLDNESEEAYILRYMPYIREIAKNEKESVQNYSDKIGLKRNGRYAVVDCIASGTTQWFMENWMPYRFDGYYLGDCNPDGRKSGNIKDYLEYRNDSILKNYIEIESFFTSYEPSVRKIDSNGEPLFLNDNRQPRDFEELRFVHELSMQYVRTFFTLFYSEDETIDSIVPEEMFAADGCHWVQNNAYDDWTGKPIPIKKWEKA